MVITKQMINLIYQNEKRLYEDILNRYVEKDHQLELEIGIHQENKYVVDLDLAYGGWLHVYLNKHRLMDIRVMIRNYYQDMLKYGVDFTDDMGEKYRKEILKKRRFKL